MLRERQRLTQLELAKKAGVGKARVSGYERGQEQPTAAALDKLLRALGASHLAFYLLVEVLKPAAAALASAGPDGDAGPAPTTMPATWGTMLGALRSNLETSAQLVAALEQSIPGSEPD